MAYGYGMLTQEELDKQAEDLAAQDAAAAPPPPPTTGTEAAAVAGAAPAAPPIDAYQGDPLAQPGLDEGGGYVEPTAPVAEPAPAPAPTPDAGPLNPQAAAMAISPGGVDYVPPPPTTATAQTAAPTPQNPNGVFLATDPAAMTSITPAQAGVPSTYTDDRGQRYDPLSAAVPPPVVPPPPTVQPSVPITTSVMGQATEDGRTPPPPPFDWDQALTDFGHLMERGLDLYTPAVAEGLGFVPRAHQTGGQPTTSSNEQFGARTGDIAGGTANWLSQYASLDPTDIGGALADTATNLNDKTYQGVKDAEELATLLGASQKEAQQTMTPEESAFQAAMLMAGLGDVAYPKGGFGGMPGFKGAIREAPRAGITDIVEPPPKVPAEPIVIERKGGPKVATEEAPTNGRIPEEIIPPASTHSYTLETEAPPLNPRQAAESLSPPHPDTVPPPAASTWNQKWGNTRASAEDIRGVQEYQTQQAAKRETEGRQGFEDYLAGKTTEAPSNPATEQGFKDYLAGKTTPAPQEPATIGGGAPKGIAAGEQQAATTAANRLTEQQIKDSLAGKAITAPEEPAAGGGGAGKAVSEATAKQAAADAKISEALGKKLLEGQAGIRSGMEDIIDQADFAQTLRDASPKVRDAWNAAVRSEQKLTAEQVAAQTKHDADVLAQEERFRQKNPVTKKNVVPAGEEGILKGKDFNRDYGFLGNMGKAVKDTAGEFGGIGPLLAGAAAAAPVVGFSGLALGQKAKNNTEASLRNAEAGVEQWLREHGGADLAQWSQDNIGPNLGAAKDTAKAAADVAGGLKDRGFSGIGDLSPEEIQKALQGLDVPGQLPDNLDALGPLGKYLEDQGLPTGKDIPGMVGQAAQNFAGYRDDPSRAILDVLNLEKEAGLGIAERAGPILKQTGDAVDQSPIPEMLAGAGFPSREQIWGDVQKAKDDPSAAANQGFESLQALVQAAKDKAAQATGRDKATMSRDDWMSSAYDTGVPTEATAQQTMKNYPRVILLETVDPETGKPMVWGAKDQNGKFIPNLGSDQESKDRFMAKVAAIEAAGGSLGFDPKQAAKANEVAAPEGTPAAPTTTDTAATPATSGDGSGGGGGGGSGRTWVDYPEKTYYPYHRYSSGSGGGSSYRSYGSSGRSYGGGGGYSGGGGSSFGRGKKKKKGMGGGGGMWPGFPFNRPNSPIRQHILDALAASVNKPKRS